MKWQDSRIAEDVADELSDLKTVIDIISQLPKTVANRILTYCQSYVNNRGESDLPPTAEIKAAKIKEALIESLLKENKEL